MAVEHERTAPTHPRNHSSTHRTSRTHSTSLLVPTLLITLLAAFLALARLPSRVELSRLRSEYYTRTLMSSPSPRKLRIGTFNVRRDGDEAHPLLAGVSKAAQSVFTLRKEEQSGRWGERSWRERRDKLVDQVLFEELDVVGFQEVLEGQLRDLRALMGEEWAYVGVGRDDGRKAGEAVPVFFRKSRLSLLRSAYFWLSPTPNNFGSKGWDAGQPRMVTFAWLRDLGRPRAAPAGEDGTASADFVVLNTHWDDRGLEARTQSAALILRLVESEVLAPAREKGEKEPLVVLLGDLNSVAEEEGYQVLTGRRYGGKEVEAGRAFADARREIAKRGTELEGPGAMSGRFGSLNTFTGFVPSDVPKVIDFVMLYSNSAFALPSSPSFLSSPPPDKEETPPPRTSPRWKVSRYGVLPNFFEYIGGGRGEEADGVVVSDHRLVVVGLEEVVA